MWFLGIIQGVEDFSMRSGWDDPVFQSFADKFFPNYTQMESAWRAAKKTLDSLKDDGYLEATVVSRKTKHGGGTVTKWTRRTHTNY